MLEHTAGRRYHTQFCNGYSGAIGPFKDWSVFDGEREIIQHQTEERARRIAALLNAAEGFTTEALESGAVPALLAAVEAQHAACEHVRTCEECGPDRLCRSYWEQRDEADRLVAAALRACGRGDQS